MSNGLRDDLVAHWSMDEASNEDRLDSTQNNHDATDNGTTPAITGLINNGAEPGFGGSTSDFFTVTNHPDFQFGDSDFTIAGYINFGDNTTSHAICGMWEAPNDRRSYIVLFNQSTNVIRFSVSSDGTSGTLTQLDFSYTGDDTWAHFAAIHDAENNELRLHVTPVGDGTLAIAQTTAHSTGTYVNSTDPFDIGRRVGGSTQVGQAKIDELAVWSRALSTADLSTHYNGGSGLAFSQWTLSSGPGTGYGDNTMSSWDYARRKKHA